MLPQPQPVRLSTEARFPAQGAVRPEARGQPDAEEVADRHVAGIQDAALAIDHARLRAGLCHQFDPGSVQTVDRKRPRPVAQRRDNQVGLVDDPGHFGFVRTQLVQAQAGLGTAPADAARLHHQFPRVQPETREPEYTLADRAYVVLGPLRIAVGVRRGTVGVVDPQWTAMQQADAGVAELDAGKPVQQGVRHCRGAGRSADDRDLGARLAAQHVRDARQTGSGQHLARLHQALARPLVQVQPIDRLCRQAFGRLVRPRRYHQISGQKRFLPPGIHIHDVNMPAAVDAAGPFHAMSRHDGACGVLVDNPFEGAAHKCQEVSGFRKGYCAVSGLGDAPGDEMIGEAGQFAFFRSQQAIREASAAAVRVDGIVADRAAAQVAASLHDGDAAVEQRVQFAVAVRGEQGRDPAGAAPDDHHLQHPLRIAHNRFPYFQPDDVDTGIASLLQAQTTRNARLFPRCGFSIRHAGTAYLGSLCNIV